MPDHLLLPERIPLDSRRQGSGGGSGSQARNPHRHGERLRQRLGRALERLRPIRIVEGVDPMRVFKISVRANARVTDTTWTAKDLYFLGETEDWTYFVLSEEERPERLLAQLDTYAQGPDLDGARAPNYTFFDAVEDIEPYGPEDRRGVGIPERLDLVAEPLVVDALAWPSDSHEEAERRLAQMRGAISQYGGEEIASDARARFTVLRARVGRDALGALLELAVVESVRTPSIPYLEPSEWYNATLEELAVEREDSEPIGIIDDGIAEHPLLDGLVASRRSFPPDHDWAPIGTHGTMVAGLALFGELESALRDRHPLQAHGVVHQARVLEPDPHLPPATRFAPEAISHQAIERAIETLHSEEGVRVFNLSITDPHAYSGPHVSLLTQRLDELIRDLDIVVVVSAGNHSADVRNGRMSSGHHAADAYPLYLAHPDARVAEPAPAALALTVGSLARFDAPQTRAGVARVGDHAIAAAGEISPFSRTGPGAFRCIKPDVVDHGGNWVITDTGTLDHENPGVGVLSLGGGGATGRMFSLATGTSFAAPRVARLAARVWHAYPSSSANLIRALIAIASRTPEAARRQFQQPSELINAIGYGQPREDLALRSGGPRVVMLFDGELPTDTAAIHPVPMPPVFTRGSTARRIAVALAFDPPVRRQRREYLAGKMSYDLLRNVTVEDVRARYERQGATRVPLYTRQHEKLELTPGTRTTENSTLQLRHFETPGLDPDDGDAYYLAVSHQSAPWAEGGDQRYALAVELLEQERQEVDLYAAVQQQVRVRARVRLRR